MASSQAQRLKPHAIDVRVNVDPVQWFLNDRHDTRSSYYLEDAATEFQVQGLELDWVCVTWDADLRRHAETWRYHSFRGDAWTTIHKEDRKRYLLNAYRVLLTRARQGMVIFVPPGDESDPTRAPPSTTTPTIISRGWASRSCESELCSCRSCRPQRNQQIRIPPNHPLPSLASQQVRDRPTTLAADRCLDAYLAAAVHRLASSLFCCESDGMLVRSGQVCGEFWSQVANTIEIAADSRTHEGPPPFLLVRMQNPDDLVERGVGGTKKRQTHYPPRHSCLLAWGEALRLRGS